MKTGIIVQARMGSERLPGKVMLNIDENPMLFYVINQLRYCKLADVIIIATTSNKEDDVIEKYAKSQNIECFRGNDGDVLDRYYQCAKKYNISTIVRITCDDPLIDPVIVDQTIRKFYSDDFDFVTNRMSRTFPFGTEVDVFSFESFSNLWKKAKKPSEREHVIPYYYNNSHDFSIFNISNPENLSHLSWSVDRKNDLLFVREIVLRIKNRPILMNDILLLLKKEPKLMQINSNRIPDEGYLKSLDEDKSKGFV